MRFAKWFAQIEPTVLERGCGGWLAVSEPGAPLKIGVEGDTEQQARERFAVALAAWHRLFETDDI